MANGQQKPGLLQACERFLAHLMASLRKDNIWQRISKNVLCTTISIIIGVIPAVIKIYGKSTYLGAMTTIFGYPGQRFGKVVESLSLIALGTLLGLGWADFGLYLSGCVGSNISARYTIRAIFFVLAVIIHGLLRSAAPRLFHLVLFFMLVNLSVLTSSSTTVTLSAAKGVIYPIFTAIGVVILVNVTIFPQFSSGFLGTSTINALSETISSFQEAGDWFMSKTETEGEEEPSPTAMRARLAMLSNEKPTLRTRLGNCKTVQAECNFELVFAVLPPRSLKPISVAMMTRLVQVTVSLINACESKFALEASNEEESVNQIELDSSSDEEFIQHQRNIALVKPIREIESGDVDSLEHIMSQIRHTAKEMQDQIQDAVRLITSALAYCYDVSQLPPGTLRPDGILLQEMDIRMDIFAKALSKFDSESALALESADLVSNGRNSIDTFAPRMETHLVSCFLISINQAARQVLEMLKYARGLVERRQAGNGRRKLYWPHISWKKWLTSGGEEDGNVLPENARKAARAGHGSIEDTKSEADEHATKDVHAAPRSAKDEEAGARGLQEDTPSPDEKESHRKDSQEPQTSRALWVRGQAAEIIEFFQNSDHLAFALRLTIAALLVTWPAFVPSLNDWYVSVRGTWATLQLILVFEVSIGTTFLGFFFRALGTTFGCSIGIIAWELGKGNRVVLAVVLALGLLPASYVHVATTYVKAGSICMVSLSVVGLCTHYTPYLVANELTNYEIATVAGVNADAPWQIYVKRLVCFLVGGTVALFVEMTLYPVRARDRLVESLVSSISQISVMESSVAIGVESRNVAESKPQPRNENFKSAKDKAERALDAARTFLPFTLTEPRIKGSFKGQALVYGEMIHVLFQIIDRMDNMLHIRQLFGSDVLEELHDEILPCRRNVAGCVTLTLFMVQEALMTRMPLPQFLPSSRVAQLRSVARVRELLLARDQASVSVIDEKARAVPLPQHGSSKANDNSVAPKRVTQQALLAWKASSAGMMEIIEYLEELVDLTKLLVGVNAFRSGLLEHHAFHEYNAKIRALQAEVDATNARVTSNENTASNTQWGGRRRRLTTFGRRPSLVAPSASFNTGLRRRQTAGSTPANTGDSTFDDDYPVERQDISWSLQRVISKRVEETRSNRRGSEGPKGKHALRSVQTWTG